VSAWLHENAGQLALDPARIGIKGESGGGGLAAAAVIYARDRQGPKFAFRHLIYPMIDDRTAVRKDLHPHVGESSGRMSTTISAGIRCSAGSLAQPVSRLMRRPHGQWMRRASCLARAPRVDGGACSGSA
jgi:acetyl esterase/lipase